MKKFSLSSGGMDPCNFGPLTCGPSNVQDVANDQEENITLFSAASKRGRASLGTVRNQVSRSSTNLSNPSMNPLDNLKERVEDFQSRGWLSQQEYRKYMAFLDTAPFPDQKNPAVAADYAQNELVKELDALEDRMTGGKELLFRNTLKTVMTPRRAAQKKRADQKNNESQAEFPELPPTGSEPLADSINNASRNAKLSVARPEDVAEQFSEEQIEEVFVETCFFARLGFVQPPCCLQCTYRESLKGAIPNPKCGRWVLWRRNASHILHPKTLDENTLLVRCYAARKLLAGGEIDSYKWDEARKVLEESIASYKDSD